MVSRKNALGKGLSALLENTKTDITSSNDHQKSDVVGSITRIKISSISPNPFQPRLDFDKEPLLELSNSIKEHGIIQPITVRKIGRNEFQIISGERRYQASKLAGIDELPCFIRIADDDYKNMLIESAAKDVVYTNYFSGVHGNYLSPSVERAGMDPLNLPEADKTKMNFNSGGNASAKVWKDIYGSGQGINSIKDSPKVEDLVGKMKAEFQQARSEFSTKSNYY